MSNTSFNDQPHIERLFRVLYMLQSVKYYKTAEIAEAVGVSARTVHRYIEEFRNSGFEIVVERQCFRLKTESVRNKSIIDIMSGTSEWQRVNNVENLAAAIETHKYVKLVGYASGHSRIVADRVVEPFELTKNKKYVWCYDHDAGYCKTFCPSRCQKVEVLERDWEHLDQFNSENIDLFGFHGTEPIHVVLKLDVLAHNLLIEENSEAALEMTEVEDDMWLLDTNVYDLQGVGRFCMGLLWHFYVVDAPELFEYLCDVCDEFSNIESDTTYTLIDENMKTLKEMKVLSLIVTQHWFDEILSGRKKQEFRDIKPNNIKKYHEVDANGDEVRVEEKDGWYFVPRKYDAIRFYVGYNKDRDMALVEVKDAHIDLLFDQDTNEIITYEYNGNEYYAAQVVYDLGKIIEKKVK